MYKALSTSAACLAVATLAGCVGGPQPVETAKIAPPLYALPTIEKSPAYAGIYFSPGFASAKYMRHLGPDTYVFPIGEASVYLFDYAFRSAFARTRRIYDLTPNALAEAGVDVAIAPSLQYFNVRHGFDGDGPSERWSVIYRLTLYSRAGVPVVSWIVKGDDPAGYWFDGAKSDLESAGREFLREFKRDAGPALAAIAGNADGRSGAIDSASIAVNARPTTLNGFKPETAAALQQAGVVPIRVGVRSASPRKLVVRGSDTRLRMANGQWIEPASLDTIVSALEDPNASGLAWGLGGILGAVAAAQSQQEQRGQMASFVSETLLAERTLENGKEISGVVMYRLPGGGQLAGGAALSAWIVDPTAASGVRFDVPLTGAPGTIASTAAGAKPSPHHEPQRSAAPAQPAVAQIAQAGGDKEARLRELKALKEKGLISDDVYRDEQRRILSDTPPAAAPTPAPAAPAPTASGPPPPDGVSLGFLLGMGAKKLSAAETRTVLTSGVIRGATPTGAAVVVSYNPDGTLTGTINGNDISDGKWRIDSAGRSCVDLWIPRYKQTFENLCRHWFMLGETLYFPSDSETAQDPNARMSRRTLTRR